MKIMCKKFLKFYDRDKIATCGIIPTFTLQEIGRYP